jgi:excisionase family DNA binding protein
MSRNGRKESVMEGSVMEERYLSLAEACEVLGKSERTLYRWIKSGKLKAYKPGRDYEIPESAIQEMRERSEVYPKVQASLWPEEEPERRNPEPGEAERRLSKVPEALGEYIGGRAKQHDAEIRDPASPHFASATAGTLYLAGIEDEFDAWCSWAARTMPEIMLIREGLGKQIVGTLLETFSVMGVMLFWGGMRKRARRRIQAMESVPDELATRRLEVVTARAEESRKRLIELEVASG